MIDYVVMGSNRPEKYILKLIKSLKNSSNKYIKIIIDSNDDYYLNEYKKDNFIKINKLSDEEFQNIKNISIFEKMLVMYNKCLLSIENDGIIFEDDIIFSKNWENSFYECLEKLKCQYDDNFMLSLFTSKDLKIDTSSKYHLYPQDVFFGSLGIYFTKTIKNKFIEYIKNYKGPQPHDMVLKEFIKTHQLPFFVTIPCLIEHKGIVSTWKKSPYMVRAIEF